MQEDEPFSGLRLKESRGTGNYNTKGKVHTHKGGQHARNATSGGFVLTLKFTGQQVAGMRGMFSQQCWLNSFGLPMSIVEPFVTDSMLMHTKEMWQREEGKTNPMSLRLSNFYRMPSRGDTGITMSTWERFLSAAPRKLIVVNIENVYGRSCLNFGPKTCNEQSGSQLLQLKCKPLKMIKDSVAYLEAHGFQVVRKVCFNCSSSEITKFSPNYVTEYIFGDYKPHDVTVLISHWKFSFQITPHCAAHACDRLAESFKEVQSPSNLGRAAARYSDVIDRLQGRAGQPVDITIAVMVRLEWFLITYRDSSLEKIDSCLQTVVKTKQELESAANGTTRVLLALDVGKFGSGSFNKTIQLHITHTYFEAVLAKVKNIVLQLYNRKLTFDLWEESYASAAGGSTDRSYIAALQSLVASKADCLVLMGGGHFQELALQKYTTRAPAKRCVHKVCTW